MFLFLSLINSFLTGIFVLLEDLTHIVVYGMILIIPLTKIEPAKNKTIDRAAGIVIENSVNVILMHSRMFWFEIMV
jgi:hypothetical protein